MEGTCHDIVLVFNAPIKHGAEFCLAGLLLVPSSGSFPLGDDTERMLRMDGA